jgi:hypothetical protein
LPFLLRSNLVGVVGNDFSHSAAHIPRQLALYELLVKANSKSDHHNQRNYRRQQDDHHVAVGLVARRLHLHALSRAVLGRRYQARADSVSYLFRVEVSPVNHVVDGNLRETVEAEQGFPGSPRSESGHWIYVVDVVHAHLLED